ncbi:hypothetical protein GLW20_01630 [Virgibacillus halodenitrificans]|nr:hypothetical protein [Virgibacillus halodenitrificans]
MHDVEMMTLSEFHYKRYAQEYKDIDEEYRMHKIAFLIRNAAATKNVGTEKKPKEKYVFGTFESFFDYESALKEVDQVVNTEQEAPKHLSPAQLAAERNRKG